jgi:hypothetical protein
MLSVTKLNDVKLIVIILNVEYSYVILNDDMPSVIFNCYD